MDYFEQLREIAALTRSEEQDRIGREKLIRFLDEYPGNTVEQPIVDSLCARFGLYPYMSPNRELTGILEAFAVEMHSPPALAKENFRFHSDQQKVYNRLMNGENVILSAPTSFGKSVIMDAVVASGKWSNIVIIVPTIALIDEIRRRLARFHGSFNILTHPSETLGSKNLLIMTQERFLDVPQLPPIDFFTIDEFYKLGLGDRNDQRRTLLNLAWLKLRSTGAQFYLTGPNIHRLDDRLSPSLRESLLRTDFNPVTVDVFDRSDVPNQFEDLIDLIRGGLTGSTLIFTGSPDKASELAVRLVAEIDFGKSPFISEVAEWIGDNYDTGWDIVRALRSGVGVHSGPLPRGLQRLMIRMFNDRQISMLVCTSTLIEGVNTSAKNIVIYSKKIDGRLLDFFTFSNIKGRAGRMFQHFVGRVFTYMEPPMHAENSVDIPIESQSAMASKADLIHINAEELTSSSRKKLSSVVDQSILSLEAIRRNRGIDPDLQLEAAQVMQSLPAKRAALLSWSGKPTNTQFYKTIEFAFNHLLASSQRSGMNARLLWGRLSNARDNAHSLSKQVDQQMLYNRRGLTRSQVVDDVLRFQRNWMGFTIPSMLRATQVIQNEVLANRNRQPKADYEYLIREIESLYLPPKVVELEEYGVPSPLGIRLVDLGLSGNDRSDLLRNLVDIVRKQSVRRQLSNVDTWILDDVVKGLTGE
ncbi:hypothetical protein HMPREF2752_08090 [Corynebacterium sp. HMSC077C02]|uniref:DEAD/DEAH box helicase n=1 Tax=Corynebacterium sp. HMSC077C02 TaxID=1739256 RepID=UPI0008A421C1|nr:DEAD/DEAH box helicase [Corynebacterium sp. HMSC077C02]OFL74585.1 hypothetical protein HMPREF2752_08090 [Corynebacterium sp. HMSC077C02]